MAYVVVHGKKIQHNMAQMRDLAAQWGAQLCCVTKFCLSRDNMLALGEPLGLTRFADSNSLNFTVNHFTAPDTHFHKSLIKTRISDIRQWKNLAPAARADRFFVSHRALLDEIRRIPGRDKPEVVLIVEMGDLKDGLHPGDIPQIDQDYSNLPIVGVSTNFACLSGAMPSLAALKTLRDLAQEIQIHRNLPAPFVSVGGTVMHDLLVREEPETGLFQELRCGEGIYFGYNSSGGGPLAGFETDTMTLHGEILEVAEKDVPLAPKQSALTALGKHAHARPAGRRLSAVLDFGILGANERELSPVDTRAVVVGQTFDFTVVDITDSPIHYQPGEFFPFKVHYGAGSFLFMNPFIPSVVQ